MSFRLQSDELLHLLYPRATTKLQVETQIPLNSSSTTLPSVASLHPVVGAGGVSSSFQSHQANQTILIKPQTLGRKRKNADIIEQPKKDTTFDFSNKKVIPSLTKPAEPEEKTKPVKPVSEKKKKKILEQMAKFESQVGDVLSVGKLVNMYEIIDKKYLPDPKAKQYANYDKIHIDLPFQCLLIGATGSGKTSCFENLIYGIGFHKIIIVARNTEEPLYKHLIDKFRKLEQQLEERFIWVFNRFSEMPDVTEINKMLAGEKGVMVCDDLVTEPEKDQKRVMDYFSQGRKQGDGGLSCIYISQGYTEIPRFIRKQAKIICLGTITGKDDLKRIVKQYTLDVTPEELLHMHKQIQQESTMNFLTIDLTKTKPGEEYLKYRKNFNPNPPPQEDHEFY